MDTDDRFIAGMRDTARKMAAHDHGPRPSVGAPDLYCLNLSAWAGERTAALLDRYDAAVRRAIDAEQAHERDREEWETTKRALAANATALATAEAEHGDLADKYGRALDMVSGLQLALVRAQGLAAQVGQWVDECDAHKANHDGLIAAYREYEESK